MKLKTINKRYCIAFNGVVFSLSLLSGSLAYAEMHHNSHSDMSSESAPAEARDPHAYSDGYTLTQGLYVHPNAMQLIMAHGHGSWAVLVDQLEYQSDHEAYAYDVQAWYGSSYDRFVVKAEGDIKEDVVQESSTELLWSHAQTAYFDSLLGARVDYSRDGDEHEWLALGLQGLAPYWFETDINAYVDDQGQVLISAGAEYDLLITQKWLLQPSAALNWYAKDDLENEIGAGLSDLTFGLRLRYEISPKFAPYVGVEWTNSYGDAADFLEAKGHDRNTQQWVAGLKFWF